MENALYTPKTLKNQALTVRPWGNRITLPILLPVLLVTLLILSACGGGKATINVTQNPPPPTCEANSLFDPLCTPDVNAQRAFCRMGTNAADNPTNCGPVVVGICADDPFDGLCTVDNTAREDFCRKGDNLTARAGDCAPVAIRVCANRVFDGLCRNHATQRSNLCIGTLAGITTAGGVPGDCVTYSSTICGFNGAAGTNPFAPICSRIDANSQFATNVRSRNAFCRADLFNSLCDDDYADAQVSVCHVNGVPTDVNPRCAIIIANNCPFTSEARNSACYTLPTALDAAGSTDPEVNYVTGTADELNLVFSQSAVPGNISSFASGELRLSDLDNVMTDDGHGVAWATFINSQSKYVAGKQGRQRFYAGLLSATISATTGLATPAISRNVKRAEWDGKIALYARETNRTTPFDFTLLVDFDGNGGRLRANIDIPIPGNNPNNINDLFIIDGAFNKAGVVYGNTSLNGLNAKQESRRSTGSLMGVIGENGVVAAFISDGTELDSRGLGNYVGGFVASNPYIGDTTVVACGSARTDTPFDPRCVDNDALRVMLCGTRNALAGTGNTLATNCANDRNVINAICTSSGQYANPFDSVICTDNDLEVQNAFVANCINSDISLRAGADCAGVTACVNDPFATGCDAATYAGRRSLTLNFCNAGNVDDPQCANALVNCATATPDANCGALATTYCAGAAGRSITGDTSTCPARVTPYCVEYSVNPICEDITENTAFDAVALKQNREDLCRMPIHANNPDCAITIAVYCDAADNNQIFESICSNRVHFTQTVIASVCQDSNRDTRLDDLCDTPHAYDIQRLERCEATQFASNKCGIRITGERHTLLRAICGNDESNARDEQGSNPNDPVCTDFDYVYSRNVSTCGTSAMTGRDGTNPLSPICEVDPRDLITVAALCGQGFEDGTIGINPFSAICANDRFNPHSATRLEAQRNFCRQDVTDDLCPSTITAYCGTATGADLFDDLCDGTTYVDARVAHCETAFTHAKCETNQMNIGEAAAICGTESAPGTNPFNDVCKSKTLSPNITVMSLKATQQAFCRASANISESICEGTIARFCDLPTNSDVIFDDLCGGTDYTGARLAYCIHPTRSAHAECTATDADNKATLITLCTDSTDGLTLATNPFSVACREAFSLRTQIDALCGGGRNAQVALCMDENAIPDIDRESVTASQENFCRGNIALPACEETIANVCDFATGTDVLDTLCGGETYQDLRLITCLNGDTNHENCRGTAGIVATLCPTTNGMPRHESCPIIVDHDLYTSSVDDLDVNDDTRSGSIDALSAAGVKNKNNFNVFNNDVTRAIGFVTDSPATLIRGTSTGLSFGTLPADGTLIRNGGDPFRVSVRIAQNTNTDRYTIGGTNYGYALATATITASENSDNTFISSETKLYAGLLTYGGFGAPNFDNPSVGIWNATMNLRGLSGATASATFDLSVDFISQTIRTHATRLAEFTLASASFQEPQFTPIGSHVFELKNPFTLKTFYQRNSRGEDIVVTSRDTYTDCNGNVLPQGSKVPLCKGGGSPDYLTSSYGILRLDPNGNPMIRTESKTTTGRLTIDASFTRLGLIHGGINIQTGVLNDDGDFIGRNRGDVINNPGTLVGRISTNQLFAAFASNAGSAVAYAGGFTATPLAGGTTFFTSGGTDKLTLTGIAQAADATSAGWTSNEDYVIDGTTNGFALASVNVDDGNGGFERDLYAGILTGTNLGNPLFDNSATGTWNAKLNLIMLGSTAAADFDLHVDFNTRTIETYADRPAQFTLAGEDFRAAKRSAKGSTMVTLLHPTNMDGGSPAPYYKQDSSGANILVKSGETINDCAGMPIAAFNAIPLCTGGGNIVYITDSQGRVVLDDNGKPTFETVAIPPVGRLTINGRFSSTGKITGTTDIKLVEERFSNTFRGRTGTLTGLIGEAGLVATFISDVIVGAEGNELRDVNGELFIGSYAGGFTATPWVCTAGGTPFSKTNCPDANIDAKALRLQLCLDRDPAAKPFATNCAGDATITTVVCTGTGTYANPFDADICPTADDNVKTTFVNSCFADAGHANACATGQVARCLHDPYAFVCKSSMYETARTAHLDTCGIATAPPNPRCANLRAQLNSCSVAQPDQSCGTLVNDYCFGGAGRAIAGKTTCVENIRVACVANALHPRCRDLGVFPTEIAHVAHINKQRDFCAGDLTNLPTGATVSDCNTLGITVQICGSPTAVGTNPFATICSNAMGNPYSEARELKIIQTVFCKQGAQGVNNDCNTLQQQLDSEFEQIGGKTPYWADNAIREVATPVLDENGNIKTTPHPDSVSMRVIHPNPVTKLVQFPIKITPAGKIRRDDAAVNYIVGGVSELNLASLIELGEDGQPKVDSTGEVIDHTPVTNGINNRGGLKLSNFDGNEDAASGFAFASATFATRSYRVEFGDGPNADHRGFTNRTFGGTKLYTGLLADTDVGAPVSDFQTEVEWTGKIDMIYGRGVDTTGERNVSVADFVPQNFTLLVSFYGNFGSIRNKAPIIFNSSRILNIDGRFTDRGLIYGKTRLSNGGHTTASGSLTGLIGAEGAVAVFVSDDENPSKSNVNAAYFGNYAGGFVAIPPATPSTAPRADFATWLASFQAPNIPLTQAIRTQDFTEENDKQYFVQGTVSTLNRANDNYGNENRKTNNPITLTLDNQFNDGNIYDGIAYLRGTHKRAYAGILLGTALGAPVTGVAETTARWAGLFQSSWHITSPTSFALIVGFTAGGGGTLDALVESSFGGDRRAGIDGAFDAGGIITGEVIYGEPKAGGCLTNGVLTVTESCFKDLIPDSSLIVKSTATLTGLIGEQGAVAAFTGEIPGNRGWAGGFVATPDFCANRPTDPYCIVNIADLVDYFGNDVPPATIAATATGDNIFGGFLNLATDETTIAAGGLTTMTATAIGGGAATPAAAVELNRPGSGKHGTQFIDGVTYISGFNGDNHQAFVGILPSTTLGAPLIEQPATAAWNGRYYDSTHVSVSNVITFNIDFDASSINTSGITVTNPPTFDLGFTRAGVITGTVTKNSIEATARGLIGEQGLVGVFVDTSPAAGPVFHGGFWADNPDN